MEAAPSIGSRTEFQAGLRWGLAASIERGARQIFCVDPEFTDWPLDDPALLDVLGQWLKLPQRRLTFLAQRYDEMALRHPRFVAWRRIWAHAIEFRSPEEMGSEVPALLLDDTAVCVQLFDSVHWRGRAEIDPRTATVLRQSLDALIQRSVPAFPVSTLGL